MKGPKDGQKEHLTRILRSIIRTNRIDHGDPLTRHRLKGAATVRAQAVSDAQNLLAIIQMKGRSRAWLPLTKNVVAGLRKMAEDMRLVADARMVAVKRLAYLAGFATEPPSDEPLDRLLRTFVEKPTSSVTGIDFNAIAAAAMKK